MNQDRQTMTEVFPTNGKKSATLLLNAEKSIEHNGDSAFTAPGLETPAEIQMNLFQKVLLEDINRDIAFDQFRNYPVFHHLSELQRKVDHLDPNFYNQNFFNSIIDYSPNRSLAIYRYPVYQKGSEGITEEKILDVARVCRIFVFCDLRHVIQTCNLHLDGAGIFELHKPYHFWVEGAQKQTLQVTARDRGTALNSKLVVTFEKHVPDYPCIQGFSFFRKTPVIPLDINKFNS